MNLSTKPIARILLTNLTILSGLIAFEHAAIADNSQSRYQYPEAEQQAYLSACQQVVSEDQGFSSQQSQNLCQCTLQQFKNQYTIEQFRQLYAAANQNNRVPTEFIKAGISCAAQLSLK